jgi:hypothetical protein
MIWYKNLFISENISQKKAKIKWKIRSNAGLINIYVITLAANPQNLLEIVSTIELMQAAYPKQNLFIVGIAKGYDTAVALASRIIIEIYKETGEFKIREYMLMKQQISRKRAPL